MWPAMAEKIGRPNPSVRACYTVKPSALIKPSSRAATATPSLFITKHFHQQSFPPSRQRRSQASAFPKNSLPFRSKFCKIFHDDDRKRRLLHAITPCPPIRCEKLAAAPELHAEGGSAKCGLNCSRAGFATPGRTCDGLQGSFLDDVRHHRAAAGGIRSLSHPYRG